MSRMIDKSASGNIIIPDILYESPQRMIIVDPANVAAHLDVASEFAGEDKREIERKLILLGNAEKTETDPAKLEQLAKAIEQTTKDLEDAKDMETIFFNLAVLIATMAKKNGGDHVVIPCPPRFAELLWKARPSQGDPAVFRDYPGWWNFDAYRLDDYVPTP